MGNVIASPSVQEELRYYGLSAKNAVLIRHKEGVIVVRVSWNGGSAVLKCFENAEFCREIQSYDILERCGISTIAVLGKSDRSILLEDINSSVTYRLGEEGDLNNPQVIRALAAWYRTLHTNGEKYVLQYGAGMYEEWDCLTMMNIEAIRSRFRLSYCEGIEAFVDHYGKLLKIMDAIPRTLTYNDFHFSNMVVKKDASGAMMLDYNFLGKGCYVSDIRNVIYWLSEENRELFFSAYGEFDEKLFLIDKICSPLVTLYSAMKRNIFPGWAKKAMDDLEEIPKLISELSL